MKNIGKRTLSLLLTVVMLMSLVAVSGMSVMAEEESHMLFNYGTASFVGPAGAYEVVSDPDAYNQQATLYTGRNMTGVLPLYRYCAGETTQHQKLGEVNLKADGKYHTYYMTVSLAETDYTADGGYVYFTYSSVIQNHHMAANLKSLAGQTVTITMSMKVTGSLDSANVYIDRMQILDHNCLENQVGSSCSVCGQKIVVDTSAHAIKTYGSNGEHKPWYNGESVTDGSQSAYKYTISDLSAGLKFHLSAGPNMGTLPFANILVDGAYHTYEVEIKVPKNIDEDSSTYVYMSGGWTIQNHEMDNDLKGHGDETLIVKLDVKAVENGSGHDVYIANMQLLEKDPCGKYASANGTYCTVCRKTLLNETLPEEVKLVNPKHVKQYDTDDFPPKDTSEKIVADADSPLGKAWLYRLRIGDGLEFGWNALAISDAAAQDMLITNIKYDDIKQDAGYQIYKYTLEVPGNVTKAGNFTYLDWRCCNKSIVKDLMACSGKTVDIYLSMKVTNYADGLADVYVDQMVLVDRCQNYQVGSSCSLCGDKIAVNSDAHIRYTYGQDALTGSDVISDAEAYGGRAKSYALQDLTIYIYDRGSVVKDDAGNIIDKSKQDRPIGNLPMSEIKANVGYQVYAFPFTVPTDLSSDMPFVYFNSSWGINCGAMPANLKTLAGKDVVLTVSIKSDGTNMYIDKMQVIDSCDDYVSEDGTFCTKCGASMIDETLPEELAGIHYKHLNNYTYSSFSLGDDYAAARIVDDSDSAVGKAWQETEVEIGDGLYLTRYTRISETEGKYEELISRWPDEIDYSGEYVLYSDTVEVPADIASANYVTVRANDIGEWFCQNQEMAEDLMNYVGQEVTVYLSMKAVGDETNCEIYVDRMAIVSECQWDEGVVEGTTKTYTCTVCGATKTEEVVLEAPAETWNLTLDGNISMNFNLNLTAEEAANATVAYTVNGETVTKALNGATTLSIELAAAQMADEVELVLTTDEGTLTKTYSVREYADIILAGDYTDATKNLVKYMLAYGAASQKYFDYNADDLADAGLDVEAVEVTGESAMAVTGSQTGLQYYGASLVHRNKIAMRVYFSGDLTAFPTVNGETTSPEEKNGLYYVEITDICPQDLDQVYEIAVGDLVVSYSPMDYIIRMNAKGGNSAELVQALYGYYLAAEAYAG